MHNRSDTSAYNEDEKQYIFHFGPHKTGTTSFQHLLNKNEENFSKNKIEVLSVRSKNSSSYKEWRKGYAKILHSHLLNKTNKKTTQKRLEDQLLLLKSIAPKDTKTIIISDENLLGPPPGHFIAKRTKKITSFYGAAPLVFKAINSAFHDSKITALLVERNLTELVCSLYRDFIYKLQEPLTLEEFICTLDKKLIIQHDNFYNQAKIAFDEKLRTLDFDLFTKNADTLLHELSKTKVQLSEVKQKNQSLTWNAIESAIKIIPTISSKQEKIEAQKALLKIKKTKENSQAPNKEKIRQLLEDRASQNGLTKKFFHFIQKIKRSES